MGSRTRLTTCCRMAGSATSRPLTRPPSRTERDTRSGCMAAHAAATTAPRRTPADPRDLHRLLPPRRSALRAPDPSITSTRNDPKAHSRACRSERASGRGPTSRSSGAPVASPSSARGGSAIPRRRPVADHHPPGRRPRWYRRCVDRIDRLFQRPDSAHRWHGRLAWLCGGAATMLCRASVGPDGRNAVV